MTDKRLTPVQFEPFVDPPKRDTEPSQDPPEESEIQEERGTLSGFEEAFAKVNEAIGKNSEDMTSRIESNRLELIRSLNEIRTLVVEHYQGMKVSRELHAKILRAHSAELKVLRDAVKLPEIEPFPEP